MNTTGAISRKARQHIDMPLILVSILLGCFGVVAITGATYKYGSETTAVVNWLSRITSSYYGGRQALFMIVSPLAIAGMASVSYRFFQKFSFALYLMSLGVLGMVLVMGSTTSGVTGWFDLFSGYMLQPSEFAKIATILHLAKFFARKENPVTTMREFIQMAVIMLLPVGLIFAQGELGTVMVFIVFYLGLMFMSGMHLGIIAGLLGGGALALVPVVYVMSQSGSSYRYDRLLSFFDPSKATADAIYQARNSQIAIGNGGLHGTGLFTDGTYTALSYVPQNHTDFIFASIGETMGFVGGMVVFALFLYLLYRLLTLAYHTQDKYARLVIVGVFAMMFFHIFYNIGMTIGVTPVMGIPLPFLSYGGSNLIANMASIGLVVNITLRKPMPRTASFEMERAAQMPALGRRGQAKGRQERQ